MGVRPCWQVCVARWPRCWVRLLRLVCCVARGVGGRVERAVRRCCREFVGGLVVLGGEMGWIRSTYLVESVVVEGHCGCGFYNRFDFFGDLFGCVLWVQRCDSNL